MGQNLVYTRYSKTSLCPFILDYRFDYLNLHWASPLDITDISTSTSQKWNYLHFKICISSFSTSYLPLVCQLSHVVPSPQFPPPSPPWVSPTPPIPSVSGKPLWRSHREGESPSDIHKHRPSTPASWFSLQFQFNRIFLLSICLPC